MSKRFLKLAALALIFTLVFAGSAFAKTVGETYTWVGPNGDGGDGEWGVGSNWSSKTKGTPVDGAFVVFPQSTGTVRVSKGLGETGTEDLTPLVAIRVDGGLGNAHIVIETGATLRLEGDLVDGNGTQLPALAALGNVRISGNGTLRFGTNGAEAAIGDDVAKASTVQVAANATVTVETKTESLAASTVVGLTKTGAGTLAFTGPADNAFEFASTSSGYTIREGVLSITRAGHLNGDTQKIIFNDNKVPGRKPTLAIAASLGFSATDKIHATTSGTIDTLEGATLSLGRATGTNVVVQPETDTNTTITKTGPGAINLVQTNVWGVEASKVQSPALTIAQGNVLVNDHNALTLKMTTGAAPYVAAVPVSVASGARLIVNNGYQQHVHTFGGQGDLEIREGAWFVINADSTVPGYITGAGHLQIGSSYTSAGVNASGWSFSSGLIFTNPDNKKTPAPIRDLTGGWLSHPTVKVTSQKNDYADTLVTIGSIVVIEHEDNLGTTTRGRLYLEPRRGYEIRKRPDAAGRGATLKVEEIEPGQGFSFPLKKHLFLGIGSEVFNNEDTDVDVMRNVGEVELSVPKGGRLEITNSVTFNANTLGQVGEGTIVYNNNGFQSFGANRFSVSNGNTTAREDTVNTNSPSVTTALHVWTGTAHIVSDLALDRGDIILDAGGFNGGYPILRIENGLRLPSNSLRITNESTLQTTLTEANHGTVLEAQPAFELDNISTYDNMATLYFRTAISDMQAGTLTKGSQFYLVKAFRIVGLDVNQITPFDEDGQRKEGFSPSLADTSLSFEVTHDIDIPEFTARKEFVVKTTETRTIEIPVATSTGIQPGSETTTLAGATITKDGRNPIVITVTAPETEGLIPFRVSMTSIGKPNEILGYQAVGEYTLNVSNTAVEPGDPTLGGGSLTYTGEVKAGQVLNFTVNGPWTYDGGTVVPTYSTPVVDPTGAATVANVSADGSTFDVTVSESAAVGSSFKVDMTATHVNVTQPLSLTLTVVGDTPVTAPDFNAFTIENMTAGEEVNLKIGTTFAANTTVEYASETVTGWTVTAVDPEGNFTVTGPVPAVGTHSVTFRATADGALKEAVKSFTVNPASNSTSGGGGGCSTGFAGLALLLAAPLFLRKKD